MLVVTVDFKVRPAFAADFQREMNRNARASVEHEAGCSQFDVCADPQDPTRIFLYEIYADRAAFEAHLRAQHYLEFDRKTVDWIESKAVRVLQRVCP